jgi:hypothetical protein
MTNTIPMTAKRPEGTPVDAPVWGLFIGRSEIPDGFLTNFPEEGAVATAKSLFDSSDEVRFTGETIAEVLAQVRAFWESEQRDIDAEVKWEQQVEAPVEDYFETQMPMAEVIAAEREEYEAAMWRA